MFNLFISLGEWGIGFIGVIPAWCWSLVSVLSCLCRAGGRLGVASLRWVVVPDQVPPQQGYLGCLLAAPAMVLQSAVIWEQGATGWAAILPLLLVLDTVGLVMLHGWEEW